MSNTGCSRFILVIIAVTIAATVCPLPSSAATIFSQTGPSNGFFTETSSEYWGQSFSMGPSAMVLTTVDVLLSGGGPSGEFVVDLYSNNGGLPGTLLETLSGNNDPQAPGTYTFTSTGSLLLANTTYWIVQGISIGGGFEYWN